MSVVTDRVRLEARNETGRLLRKVREFVRRYWNKLVGRVETNLKGVDDGLLKRKRLVLGVSREFWDIFSIEGNCHY